MSRERVPSLLLAVRESELSGRARPRRHSNIRPGFPRLAEESRATSDAEGPHAGPRGKPAGTARDDAGPSLADGGGSGLSVLLAGTRRPTATDSRRRPNGGAPLHTLRRPSQESLTGCFVTRARDAVKCQRVLQSAELLPPIFASIIRQMIMLRQQCRSIPSSISVIPQAPIALFVQVTRLSAVRRSCGLRIRHRSSRWALMKVFHSESSFLG